MRRGIIVWFGAGLLGLACTPEPTPGLYPPQASGGVDDDAGVVDGGAEGSGEDLTGTWALLGDWSTCVTLVGTEELRSRYVHRVEIAQEGVTLTERHTVCSAQNTPLLGLETSVPQALVDAVGTLESQGAAIGTPGRLGYTSGPVVQLWGIALEAPLTDAWPTQAELPDPRVYDFEGDGKPGATLKIGNNACEVYVIQRSVSSVYGSLQEDGSILGSGFMRTEQTVIEATNVFCASSYRTASNDAHSVVRLVRVDHLDGDGDGEVSCAEILAAELGTAWVAPDKARCATTPAP